MSVIGAGRLIRRPRPTDRSMLEVAFCVACATAGCDGAAMSAAATRPTARVRASAAALKLALLFILLTPNRNHGSRTAAVDADDRPLGAQRYGTPSTRRHRSVGINRRRAQT